MPYIAYEEALRITAPRRSAVYHQALPMQDALTLARKMLGQQKPESALRQLLRAASRDARWYSLQGEVLMQLEDYEAAHKSYREAVRREPNNNVFRQGALDAAVALKKSRTLMGRIKKLLRQLTKK
jgi:cytochrome c-type biogenesis protein CcmH/NrfG